MIDTVRHLHVHVSNRLTLFWVHHSPIQGIHDTQSLLHAFRQVIGRLPRHAVRRCVIAFELELVDYMAKVVVVLVLQVRDEVLERRLIRLVCSTRTEMEVANDLG